MAVVYIIYSKKIDRFYVGSCLDFTERLEQHNNSFFKNCYTSKSMDWELFYLIEELEHEQARKIENHIKKMKSRKYYQSLRSFPNITENLKLKYVGSSR
jgi:putative endonuclease